MSKKKSPLHIQIAQRLKADIESLSGNRLPSLRTLHDRFGVSLNTMSKAIHVLREEGLVSVRHGKGIVVRRHAGEDTLGGEGSGPAESSKARLYAKIRQAIETGTYRSGEFLPKLKYFVVTEKVTDTTVCGALAMLRERDLIHKRGKRWIVGPSSGRAGATASRKGAGPFSPAILILVPDYERWREFFVKHLRVFGMEFFSALRHRDVQFVVVQADETSALVPHYHPIGRKQILRAIDELGNRYQGTFIHSTYRAFPDMHDWITWLLQFGKPVMWFDYDNAAPSMDRRTVDNERYFRLYSDIDTAVDLAIDTLKEYGHSKVGVAEHGPYISEGWVERRVHALRRASLKHGAKLEVDVQCRQERIWPNPGEVLGEYELDDVLLRRANAIEARLQDSDPQMSPNRRRRALRDELIRSVPTLSTLARNGCTAIVTLNQYMGVNALCWLKLVGIEPPHDMSLLTFDNIPPLANHPISTLDFGFGNLGYRAAHLLIGDIPVKVDRWGNIGSEPVFIDRGSLGSPRARPLRMAV
jgi:DNA-binding transcriptional regulator YhcF (GntR family)/DNA-binding LacI/PurR family transcriptional regulator